MATTQRQQPDADRRTRPPGDRSVPKGLARVIFAKEIREIFRDKRTVFGAIVSPLLLTPALIFGTGFLINGQQKKEAVTTYTVGVIGADRSITITRALRAMPNTKIEPVDLKRADRLIASRALRVALVIPPGAEESLTANRTVALSLKLDAGNDISQSAAQRVEGALKALTEQVRAQRLKQAGLTAQFGTPLSVAEQPIKGGGSTVMFLLAMMIPYVLALSAISGGMYAANDQVAGEKERGTLETLLVTPASRRDIVLGKFCAVAALCLLSSILSVVGLAAPFVLHPAALVPGASATDAAALGSLHMSAYAVAAIAAALLPLAIFFAGLLITISTFARTQKESQSYQGPLLMVILVPAMATMFVSTDAPLIMAVAPILSATMVIKQALAGAINPAFLAVALASSVVYAGLGVFASVRLFESERVLLKT